MPKITQKSRKTHKIFMFFSFFVKFSLLKLPTILKNTKNAKNRQKCVQKVEKCDFGPRNRPPKPKNAKNVLLIPPSKPFLTHFQNEKCICPKFHENFLKKPRSISQEMRPSIFSDFLYKNMKKY